MAGAASPRSIIFHPVASSLRLPLEMFARYLFPPGGPYALRLLAGMVVLVLVTIGAIWGPALEGESSEGEHDSRLLVQLGLLSVATYMVLLIVSAHFSTSRRRSMAVSSLRGVWYAVVAAVAYRVLMQVADVGAVAIIGIATTVVVALGFSQQRDLLRRPLEGRPTPGPVENTMAQSTATNSS